MLCKVYNNYMDEKILNLTEELKAAMDNDPRFLRLKGIEDRMNNDESVMTVDLLKGMRDHSTDTYGQRQLATYVLKAEDEESRGLIILIAMNEMGVQY